MRILRYRLRHNNSTTCFAQAVELAESHDPALAIEVLVDAALASYISSGPANSLPLAEQAYRLAANAETSLRNRAASVWGYVAFLSGDPQGLIESEAGAKAMQAEVLTSLTDLRWSWIALSMFSVAATLAERFIDAEHVLGTLISAENIGDSAGPIGGLAMTRAIVAARQGRLVEALGFAEQATSHVNLLSAHLSQAGAIRAEVLHQIGRGAESVEWCDKIEPDAASRRSRPPASALEHPRSAPTSRREIHGSQRTVRKGGGAERAAGYRRALLDSVGAARYHRASQRRQYSRRAARDRLAGSLCRPAALQLSPNRRSDRTGGPRRSGRQPQACRGLPEFRLSPA